MPDILRILQTVLGIGLVIFVHELGHFLAARWCRVRVNTFSLGFGPPLLSWRRGPTTYQLAAVPLGGYVQMAGEGEVQAPGEPAPADHLQSKSVGQRFLIYSGGVLMNLVFGLVMFPVVFMSGVSFTAPRLGSPQIGSPAWQADLPAGATVLAVNGERVIDYSQIDLASALSGSDPVELLWQPEEGGEARMARIEPRRNAAAGFYLLGVTPGLDPSGKLYVEPGSPAEAAGLRTNERLIRLEAIGSAAPSPRPLDQQLRRALDSGEPLTLLVADASGQERQVVINPERRAPGGRPILGVSPPENHVEALREPDLMARLGLAIGDRVLRVDDRPIWRRAEFERALEQGPFANDLSMVVLRGDSRLELRLPAASLAERQRIAQAVGLVGDVESSQVVPSPGDAADRAGLLTGDRILRLDSRPINRWSDLQAAVGKRAKSGGPLAIEVEREGADGPLRFEVALEPLSPQPVYGFSVATAKYIFRADGFADALSAGVTATWKSLRDIWMTLKGMLLDQVSSKNLGSIIMIGQVSYSFSEEGWTRLLYFLCLLSMNLAFINVLPVPLLDGGHLLFLVLEKIRGAPLPERVVGYGQMVGLVLLGGLMVYATYNDIMRLIQ
jgi:regulator of sigma E protease